MLPITRRIRVIAIAVAIPNLPIGSVDHDLYALSYRLFACTFNGFTLGAVP